MSQVQMHIVLSCLREIVLSAWWCPITDQLNHPHGISYNVELYIIYCEPWFHSAWTWTRYMIRHLPFLHVSECSDRGHQQIFIGVGNREMVSEVMLKGGNCRAQWSGVRLGNRNIAPSGDVTRWYLVAVSAPGMSNVCHSFGLQGPPVSLAHVIFISYWAWVNT